MDPQFRPGLNEGTREERDFVLIFFNIYDIISNNFYAQSVKIIY